jgi:hypothetical protein
MMFCSLGKKNTTVGEPSSAPNAKGKAKANEGGGTIFGAQHRMTGTLLSVGFVKEMMEQDTTEYPFKYVPGKEFLPNFTLENNKRLSHLRAFQKWYFRAVKLGLDSVPVRYPARDIYWTSEEHSYLTIPFEYLQFLFRQKKLEVTQLSLWCM